MVEQRNVAVAIVLTIVTCGIYGLIWFVKITDEINILAQTPGETSGGMALVYTILTCGIYSYFWMYKMGEKLDNISLSRGMATQSRGIVYLVLSFVGLGIVSYALMQDSMNKLA